MRRSLVLGVGGQDGSILAEELMASGRQVLGLGRRESFPYPIDSPHFAYRQLDLAEAAELDSCLREFQPDEVFHVAAVHGSAGFPYEEVWGSALDVNTKSLHRVLEFARQEQPQLRVFYASSAKIFGPALRGRVDLSTPREGSCLYSITKKASGQLASFYERTHGIKTTVAILFNHESERRPSSFFIPKICKAVSSSLSNPFHREEIQTLSFHCDWSTARDFMRMALRAVEVGFAGEVIFASGTTWNGRDFVQQLFSRHGLDYAQHVVAPDYVESSFFEVDLSDTLRQIDARAREDIFTLCDRLITSPNQ
ncbi:GDP-mannose 4,6-dehydratase [Synechococcus sp. BA-124 BA4]|uniref:GDP-mannose 4,6-dehydratase n=1 Tax=Synechococcus sp. BA-124 BA4 TaxID=3110251 RepID=UPI002B21072C|nr:GDP-mannose 4,6-dehydratase [Synechococcus sp. BA-124 BA4]MEA5399603.1 GDP-mannose 4,6-dehydratase [Synechococcus sp. BA-124 BA4]